MHDKLRLELIIERPALRRAETILQDAGIVGWTVLPAISGYGGGQKWSRGTDISAATDMMVLISIGDADIIEPALTALHSLLDRHIGILNVGQVKVLRDHKF
jgi:PII-like signaling protein